MNPQITKKDLETWAGYLVDYSLGGVTKDDIIMIKGEQITWPLMSVIQDKIFKDGGIADVNIVAPDNDRGKVWGNSMAKYGSLEQINRIPDWHTERYKVMTKYIEILGVEDPDFFTGGTEELAQEIMKVDGPIKNIRLAKPWVLTLFPTKGFADLEGMTLEEYTEVIVSASTVDPRYLEEVEEDLYQLMGKSKSIRIETQCQNTGNNLKLEMSIEGRHIVKCTGKRNFPDGEVFTSPDANTVNGEIFVDLPVFQGSTTIQGIYLMFENGVIKDYKADKGFEALQKIIETDAGSHRLGEVALGMNNGINKVLMHPLFVEKLGGTLHIAIGASYPECFVGTESATPESKKVFLDSGVMNESAQHVDVVTDFKEGGSGRAVYIDDTKLEIKDNIWVIPK